MAFHAASSSSPYSYSSIHPWIYDVFLSFRDDDTSNLFVHRLSEALLCEKIEVFMTNELFWGKRISRVLEKVIETSKISIIVFSQNYASSSRCLDVLKKILECKETRYQKVFPIFYEVDPSEVRNLTNRVGQAFAEVEDRFKDETQLQGWKAALTVLSNLSGWHVQDRFDPSKISSIIQRIVGLLRCTQVYVPKHLIGIEPCIKHILSHLDIEKNDIRMVGLFGLGGIGKTTIAKAIYEVIGHHFLDRCFLQNVGEISKQEGGLVQLQKSFLLEILGSNKSFMFHNVDRGIIEIKEMLHSKRVFVILDGVDQLDQLEKLVGKCDWFGSGSRIIITTRDKKILNDHEVYFEYKVENLKEKEAIKLFSMIAFKRDKPYENFAKLTRKVIRFSEGLPLALTILGSKFHGASTQQWEHALNSYKWIPHEEIQENLKRSYDDLEENEKNIFLDMACFFKGEDIEYLIDLLDNCGYFADRGIERLKDKSLITIGKSNMLDMHVLVQDMGKEIVRLESLREPSKCSRLWLYRDVSQVLEKNMGTNKVKGLLVELSGEYEIHLNPMAFKNMRMLKLFINRSARLYGAPSFLPNELRLLDWLKYPGESMPSNFHGKKLVVVKMPKSKLKSLERFQNCQHLTVMKFPHCKFLTKIPDVSRIPNLKLLDFRGCENLNEVDGSVGSLDKLVLLDLSGCSELRIFPRSLKLRSLVSISLDHCKLLCDLPEFECQMKHLVTIRFGSTKIKELPSSFDNVVGLQRLCLAFCQELNFLKVVGDDRESNNFFGREVQPLLPQSNPTVCHLDSSLVIFPYVSTLERLDLSGTDMGSLPAGIQNFQRLYQLKLNHCRRLEEVSTLPSSLKKLYAKGCTSLERFRFNSVDSPMFRRIDLIGCFNLRRDFGKDVWDFLSSKRHPEFHELNITFPGDEIPEWFFRPNVRDGKSFKISFYKLGLEPSDGSIKGIAFCAVFGIKYKERHPVSRCIVDLISGGSKIYSFDNLFLNLCAHSMVLHYYISESFVLKGDCLEVCCRCVSGSAFIESCGVRLFYRHNEKARDRTKGGYEYVSSHMDESEGESEIYEHEYISSHQDVLDEDSNESYSRKDVPGPIASGILRRPKDKLIDCECKKKVEDHGSTESKKKVEDNGLKWVSTKEVLINWESKKKVEDDGLKDWVSTKEVLTNWESTKKVEDWVSTKGMLINWEGNVEAYGLKDWNEDYGLKDCESSVEDYGLKD